MTTTNIFNRRLPNIKQTKEVKLNIGCGKKYEKDFIGIDIRDCGQEIVWDVREGIPFPDESVDFIWSSHVMEHFTEDESENVLREMYRVLKPGGICQHRLPHQTDPTAYYFDHKTFWNESRIESLPGVPGLEGFIILQNERFNGSRSFTELVFSLKKK